MEDDKVDTGTNGNIPNSSILISNEEDANRTMTPLIVTSDEDSFDVKNLNKNVKLTATKKDNKNIKNLEDDIKEIFGERSTDKISKSSKIKNQRKSISSTGSGGGGGCSSVASSNKSSNNKNSKSPTRIQKNSPIIKSIKNEVISEPSTSSNLSSIGKRCYNEIDKFLSSLKTAPNENEYLYGFDANGKPVYGPLAKKIKGENKDDEENIENDKMQLYSNEEKPLVTIQKAQEISEKICDTTTTSPEEFNISKTSTFVETEIIEEEAPEQNVLNDNQNDKEDIVHEKLEIPSTPPPSFIPSSTAKSSESPTSTATPTTAQTNNSNTSKLKPSEDPIYRKPFELGWKREIVLRALPGSKDKGEVYYITPNGKKLRTRNEILSHLTIGLSMDNFTFSKDPLGANPDEEIIRSAKITGRTSTDIVLGKRIPKPKAPKGASPPPQHQSSSSTTTQNWSYNSNKSKSSSSIDRHHHHHQHNSSSGSSPRTISNTRISEDNSSGTNTKLSSKISSSKSSKKGEPCTIQCLPAIGMIPQLQCIKCLCLYHHECVGLDRYNDYQLSSSNDGVTSNVGSGNNDEFNRNNYKKYRKDYECASCKNHSSSTTTTSIAPSKLVLPETNNFTKNMTSNTNLQNANPNSDKLGNIRNTKNTKSNVPQQKSNDSGSGNSDTNPNNNNPQQQNPIINSSNNDLNIEKSSTMPQSIAVLNGRKYLVIRKPGISTEIKQHDSGTSSSSGLQTGDCLSSSASKKRTSSGHQSGTSSSTHSAPVKIQKVDTFANNFFGNVSLGYDVLLQIFQYLKVQELLRAACVCRVWNVVANHRSLWKTVRMKNSQVNDWSGLAASLRRNETKHLDLRKMLCLNSTEDQMWSNFAEHIKSVITLQKIDLGRCSSNVVQNLFLTTPQLRYLNAISIRSDTLNLNNLNLMNNLEELRLKTNDGCNLDGDLTPLELLINLRHLSLTSINELGLKNINILGNLINLESLEIGECSQLNEQFAIHILPKLIKLERLRLEKSTETNVTFELLKTISEMNNLLQLELVNFDIRDGFESKIIECKYLKRLLLIPTYISQSATTNQIILSSMRKLTTLDSLTWVVTMELLRVTALYVDQCEEVTKGKKTFDESIPVLKPVPGTNYIDDDNINKQSSDVQQVEILPLSKIREILADGMPNTKFKIVKVAYHATWRQNYVE